MSGDRQGLGARVFVYGALLCITIGIILSRCELPEWEKCTVKQFAQTCVPKDKQ